MAKLIIFSFGYRFGVPNNLPLLFDCRVIRNPDYKEELKQLNGLQKEVISWVRSHSMYTPILRLAYQQINYRLNSEQKQEVRVGLMCQSGRHRSVVVAEDLAALFRNDSSGLLVVVSHLNRDTWRLDLNNLPKPQPTTQETTMNYMIQTEVVTKAKCPGCSCLLIDHFEPDWYNPETEELDGQGKLNHCRDCGTCYGLD